MDRLFRLQMKLEFSDQVVIVTFVFSLMIQKFSIQEMHVILRVTKVYQDGSNVTYH